MCPFITFLFVSLSASVCLSASLSVCLSFFLPVCLALYFGCLSLYPFGGVVPGVFYLLTYYSIYLLYYTRFSWRPFHDHDDDRATYTQVHCVVLCCEHIQCLAFASFLFCLFYIALFSFCLALLGVSSIPM